MLFKGQGRINLYLTKKISKANRDRFLKYYPNSLYKVLQNCPEENDSRIFSFSGSNYLEEQLYSIVQYVNILGKPYEWIVISDGTYDVANKKLLEQIPFVKVVDFDFFENRRFDLLKKYVHSHVWAKIFYAYFSLLDCMDRTTIYLESDILLYNKFHNYNHLFKSQNWYLADTGSHFDSYYNKNYERSMFDVNNGFAIYNEKPPLEISYNYLIERFQESEFEYFTPQGAMQLMISNDSNANYFDPRYFVVNCSDHFKIQIDHKPSEIALRHFVGSVRHKMWQYSWEKVLGIK